MSHLSLTQTQLAEYLEVALKADVVPFIQGIPGSGKSGRHTCTGSSVPA